MKSKLLLMCLVLAVLIYGCENTLKTDDNKDEQKPTEIVFSETQLASYTEAQLNAFRVLYDGSFRSEYYWSPAILVCDTLVFLKIYEQNESFLKDIWADESGCPADVYQELLPQISEYTNGDFKFQRNERANKFYINENADSLIETDKEHFVNRRFAFTILSQDSFSLSYFDNSKNLIEMIFNRIKF